MEKIVFEREKIGAVMKFSDDIISKVNFSFAKIADDFYTKETTVLINAFIMAAKREEKVLTYYLERPKFLDWLLRRKKTVEILVNVKDVASPPPQLKNTVRFYYASIDEKSSS